MNRTASIASTLALLFCASCVTVQVYFPAARIQNLSEQIEAEVQRKGAEGQGLEVPAAAPAPAQPGASLEATPQPPRASSAPASPSPLHALLGISVLHAAEDVPAPDVSSPAIRAIIDSRAARVGELNRFKAEGLVGEGNDALVVARGLEAVADLGRRAAVQRLVEAENKDRRLLFEEIATAEGVDRSQIPRIQSTYAQTLRRHARPGDWVQAPDGTWAKA